MSIYTNTGLVEHAKKALALKTKYMWAGTLSPITDAYITQKVNQCKGVPASRTGYTDARVAELRKIAGKGYYGVDCVCFVKSYLWGGVGCPKYDSKYDLDAGAMYERATVKGPISTMPEIPGLIVYSKTHPHVGIYIGNGYTIESTLGARGDGVVKRKLDGFWEYWFQCPFVEYKKADVTGSTNTKKVTFAFPASVRSKPRTDSALLGKYQPGQTATVVVGSEKKDSATGFEYIRISSDTERWVIKSAIKEKI